MMFKTQRFKLILSQVKYKEIVSKIQRYASLNPPTSDPECQKCWKSVSLDYISDGCDDLNVYFDYLYHLDKSSWSDPFGCYTNYDNWYNELVSHLTKQFPNYKFTHRSDPDGGIQTDIIEIEKSLTPLKRER